MKKIISIVLAVVMALSISVTAMAQDLSSENSSGTMTVSVEVPESHNITVNYNDGGYVKLNGEKVKKGDSVEVERLADVSLSFITRSGYRLDKVSVDGVDVTDDVKYSTYAIDDIIDDRTVDVEFVKDTSLKNVIISGKVVDQDDNVIKGGTIVVDGSENVDFEKNGDYELPPLTDGRHELIIKDKDGNVIGTEEIIIEHTSEVDKIVVERTDDSTQVLRLPLDTTKARLNLRVYLEDSEDGKNDKGDIEIVIPPDEGTTDPGTSEPGTNEPSTDEPGTDDGGNISDMGDSSKTQLFAFTAAMSLLVIFVMRKKSKSAA